MHEKLRLALRAPEGEGSRQKNRDISEVIRGGPGKAASAGRVPGAARAASIKFGREWYGVSGRAWTAAFGSFLYFGQDWSGGSGQLDQRSHRASITIGRDWSGGKNYVSAGSLQKRGAAAPKNRGVSKVIWGGPRKNYVSAGSLQKRSAAV